MQDNARTAEIAAGMELPGNKGAYWRFIKRADLAAIIPWAAAEKQLYGTSPEVMALAVAELVADLVVGAAVNVSRNEMAEFAQYILDCARKGMSGADLAGIDDCIETLKNMRKRTVIHRTGLRLVKG